MIGADHCLRHTLAAIVCISWDVSCLSLLLQNGVETAFSVFEGNYFVDGMSGKVCTHYRSTLHFVVVNGYLIT